MIRDVDTVMEGGASKYADRWCYIGDIFSAGGQVASAAIQADAVNNATDAQKQQFGQITANNKPFLSTGTSALSRIAGMYGLDGGTGSGTPGTGGAPANIDPNGTFYQTPDYQFRFGQGIKGVDAGAAARGMSDSGATRKAEIAYAGNLASGEYNSYANRLMDLAKVGQGAANNQATAGQNYASNIGNLGMAGANGMSNAINGLAGTASNAFSNMKNPFGSSYSTPTGQSSGAEFGWT